MNIINRLATRTSVFRNLTDTLSKVSAEALTLRDERDRLKKENAALRLNCHALADDRNKWAQKYVETQQQAAKPRQTKARKPKAAKTDSKTV